MATTSPANAAALIARTVQQWDAVARTEPDTNRFTLYDDEADIWRLAHLRQLRYHSDVIPYSERSKWVGAFGA